MTSKRMPVRSMSPAGLAAKSYRIHLGQENGLLGRREGKTGNREEKNADASRPKRKA